MKRNWKTVNNKYRKEGNLYLSFEFLDYWNQEINEMNNKKRGGQYQYPHSMICFCSTIKTIFGIGLRQVEGLLKSLSNWIPTLKVPSYTQINRRFGKLGLDLVNSLDNTEDGQIIAIDSTGIKLFQSGEWIREKHKKRKPFLKLHIAVNVDSIQAVSQVMTEDSIDDELMSKYLVEEAEKISYVEKVMQDGAYDSYNNFEFLSKKGIQPVIRLRKNAISKGFNTRARVVRKIKKLGIQKWKEQEKYGLRWLVEIWYSAFKRRFGEYVYSRKKENIKQELLFKTMLCNMLIK